MGLFGWLKAKKKLMGPQDGLYSPAPDIVWTMGPDPAGPPEDFVPYSGCLIFNIVKWQWDESSLLLEVSTKGENPKGFGLVFGLSDGTQQDAIERWGLKGDTPVLVERQSWTIPLRHPTREIALVSQGAPTIALFKAILKWFGFESASPRYVHDKNAVMCSCTILRGLIRPEEDRFTVRMKVFLEKENWPYAEFFLNINSVTKKVWISEKDVEYREAILNWMSALVSRPPEPTEPPIPPDPQTTQ